MIKKNLFTLALLLTVVSTGFAEISHEDIYDYWDFNNGVGDAWKNPTISSGSNTSISVGSSGTSRWDENYGFGYDPSSNTPWETGNGSIFSSFKDGGEVTLSYGSGQKPTWRDSDGMSISMLICNGNTGVQNTSSHGFYCEANFSNSVTSATSGYYFAFVPSLNPDSSLNGKMKFHTNMPGTWTNKGIDIDLPAQDKLLSLTVTFTEGALIMYLDGKELLRCDGWGGDEFGFDSLESLQIGGPAPEGDDFRGLREGQAGSFVIDELAVWDKALSQKEIDSILDQEINTLPKTPSVPEPSSAILACLGLGSLLVRRKRA